MRPSSCTSSLALTPVTQTSRSAVQSFCRNGTGKNVRVAVFAKGPKAMRPLAAGADIVGAEDLMERIQKENFFEFDVVIATPDMMGVVGRLGPRAWS